MGSGKSSVGRLIARTLRGRFVDTDRLVTDAAGREITDIFAQEGEAWFRLQESRSLRSLRAGSGLVISTGGGIVTVPENLPLLKALGFVVWLEASEEVLWERVSRNNKRPLLHTENPRATLHALLEKRNPLYASVADLRVDTSGLTHMEVAGQILARQPR